MESFEYKGKWWLPNDPDNKVGGILKFDQFDAPSLELLGTFRSSWETNADKYPIILGASDTNKQFTLHLCQRTNSRTAFSVDVETCEYLVHRVYIGAWLENDDDFVFERAYFSLSYLYDWVAVTGIIHQFHGSPSKFSVSYSQPQPIEFQVNGCTISIVFGIESKSEWTARFIDERISIRLRPDSEFGFESLLRDYVNPLQFLLNLGTTKPNFLEKLLVFRKGYPDDPIYIVFPQRMYTSRTRKMVSKYHMLLRFSDIQSNLEDKIQAWFAIVERLREVLFLHQRVIATPELYLELKFLTFAQALETFHRRCRHKDRTLRARLDDLLGEAEEIMAPLIGDFVDFAEWVKNSRNYYTHLAENLQPKAAEGIELHWLTEKLIILLQSCRMSTISIDIAQQKEFFDRNEYYKFLKTQKQNPA